MEELTGFLTTKQAGERVGMDPSQIRKLLREGKLTGIRLGHDWVVSVQSVDQYAAQSGWHKARRRKKKEAK
jgi:excisionase family DNA binding protein